MSRRQQPLPRGVAVFVPAHASHNYVARATGAPALHHSFSCAHCGRPRTARACSMFRERIFGSLRSVGAGSEVLRG